MTMSIVSLNVARRLRKAGPFHLPPGAQPAHTTVTLYVDGAPARPEITVTDWRRNVSWRALMLPTEERPYGAQGHVWKVEIATPTEPTILRYHFTFPDGSILRESRQPEGSNVPIFGQWAEQDFQIAVYDPAATTPDWAQGTVFYQIFPDRFARSGNIPFPEGRRTHSQPSRFLEWGALPDHPPRGRDFFGGDLRGLIDNLPYLKDLGVGCLYLTPVFESPTNHRYDAIDYFKIDSLLGSEPDLTELIQKTHELGMRIILDGVFNHCSNHSVYFKDAQASKDSPHYRWFSFKNWPADYEGWAGHGHMPELVECPEVEEFFLGEQGVSNYWLSRGIDGWRTDVTPWVTDEFWIRFRKSVRAANPDAYIVAEKWEDATQYFLGDSYDATMNYRFAWSVQGYLAADALTPSELDDRLHTWLRDTPPALARCQMNLLDSHDTARILTFCKGDRRRMKQMVAFQLAYVGAPMIYYGDEAGLDGDYAENGRRAFPWGSADQDLTEYYRRALAFRNRTPALRTGDVETILVDDDRRLYVFARHQDGQSVYAVFNASEAPADFAFPIKAGQSGQWSDALGGASASSVTQSGQEFLPVRLGPRTAAWYAR